MENGKSFVSFAFCEIIRDFSDRFVDFAAKTVGGFWEVKYSLSKKFIFVWSDGTFQLEPSTKSLDISEKLQKISKNYENLLRIELDIRMTSNIIKQEKPRIIKHPNLFKMASSTKQAKLFIISIQKSALRRRLLKNTRKKSGEVSSQLLFDILMEVVQREIT